MIGPVVYVEDEPDDAFFMRRAFEQCAPEVELRILGNGEEAIRFFSEMLHAKPAEAARPSLILLDLNLPGLSGLEVLLQIRSQPGLRRLPVIMYSSSNQTVDIVEAYRRGCSAYLIKPHSPEKLRETVNAVTAFWIKENQYPPSVDL